MIEVFEEEGWGYCWTALVQESKRKVWCENKSWNQSCFNFKVAQLFNLQL